METASNTQEPTPAATPANVAMSAFFTRQKANEGIELALDFPDGTPSPHHIRIRGVDSDAFKKAEVEGFRRLQELFMSEDKKTPSEEDRISAELTLMASLVASWSFDQPCTTENVVAFLREAPQIAKEINRIAANRSRFFRNGSTSS